MGGCVVALDVGTTTIRCHVIDENATVIASAEDSVEILHPKPGYVEINPDELWNCVLNVLRRAIKDSGVPETELRCLGISTLRCTFLTWNRHSGIPYHNFIGWQDLRANSLVKRWNNSLYLRTLRGTCSCLYSVTRAKRFLAGSVLRLTNPLVAPRLAWALENIPGLGQAARNGDVLFGTVDTWLLYRLTNGRVHATDPSAASGTGMFDPFTLKWAGWSLRMFGFPQSILPEIRDTAGSFEYVDPQWLGFELPISCSIADQAASLVGSCCFEQGDVKITLGTGTFLNVNTGYNPEASSHGLYPQVAWKVGKEVIYQVEGSANSTGTLISWLIRIGLAKSPEETDQLAQSVEHSGVSFIPAFAGLQAPVNDDLAAAGFVGIRPTTTSAHLVRSILESIVFRAQQLYQTMRSEVRYSSSHIRIDGGVSKNEFVAQLLADLTGMPTERSENSELSAMGAAYFAGIQQGVWKTREELYKFRKVAKRYSPRIEIAKAYEPVQMKWEAAVFRMLAWYTSEPI